MKALGYPPAYAAIPPSVIVGLSAGIVSGVTADRDLDVDNTGDFTEL